MFAAGKLVNVAPDPIKLPPVMLPVVTMVFEPKLANNVVTLLLPYVAGMPLANAMLPKIYWPLMLPVVIMLAVSVPDAK